MRQITIILIQSSNHVYRNSFFFNMTIHTSFLDLHVDVQIRAESQTRLDLVVIYINITNWEKLFKKLHQIIQKWISYMKQRLTEVMVIEKSHDTYGKQIFQVHWNYTYDILKRRWKMIHESTQYKGTADQFHSDVFMWIPPVYASKMANFQVTLPNLLTRK